MGRLSSPLKTWRWHQVLPDELREDSVRSSRGRVVLRGVKRKMSNYPLRPRRRHKTRYTNYRVRIVE